MFSHFLASQIKQNFPYQPTLEQENVANALSDFLTSPNRHSVFLLTGYAGTGKTTLLSALVRTLGGLSRRCVLLAPTGRAAKVFSQYSGHSAYTIHRWIYHSDQDGSFALAENRNQDTLFIVDEASMISSEPAFSYERFSHSLLDDLISYVYQDGQGCRLILMGDTAQLPPVGQTDSPALTPSCLRGYGLEVFLGSLTQVVRQRDQSDILENATHLRNVLSGGEVDVLPKLRTSGFLDIVPISGGELIDTLERCYDRDGQEETIVITRSNKNANIYNNGIRGRILYREEPLEAGDVLMVARNNYFWTKQEKSVPFLANGEMARVVRVGRQRDLYGMSFQEADLELLAQEGMEVHANLMLSTLQTDTPALSSEQRQDLFNKVSQDYPECTSRSQLYATLRQDPYLNALQVKYAYAVTCHKAQGGQWRNVILDHGFLREDQLGRDYYRWLYTAVTRATERLYIVNYPKEYLL